MRYSEEIIEQVRSANDIVDIIGRHVRLTKKGAYYFGLCPFHGEKTASFSVSPRKQIYHCFGCGVGGNVISFLMDYENYSFTEALKVLAENAHIELPEQTEREDSSVRELRTSLLEINKEAAIYYNRILKGPSGQIGYDYFRNKRKLQDPTITHFGLGYSEKSSDSLYRYLKEKGYADELLNKSGLVTFTEKGARDKFWNRVMFPIMDTNNRVIGFGGRVMGDGEPKYLNSPETLIFDKSSTLYGLNFAKKSRAKFLLLCEGYMDVIALHQAGFTNAVASLGTAFTEKHARLLKRYTDSVILTQDSDKAGINAKLKAFPLLYEAGINVKVLDMGKYKDPDEFIKAEGPEGYEKCIRNAKNAFIYLVGVLRDNYDLSDPAEKTKYIRDIAQRLCMFRDAMERDNYIDSVSREFMIDREELKKLVDRMAANGVGTEAFAEKERPHPVYHAPAQSESQNEEQNLALQYEKILVSWLAENPNLSEVVFRYMTKEDIHTPIYHVMLDDILKKGSAFDPAAFLDRSDLNTEDRKQAAECFAESDKSGSVYQLSDSEMVKGLTEAIRAIRAARIDSEMDKCGTDLKRFGELIKEKNALKNLTVQL